MPADPFPMLASAGAPPSGRGWMHEVKWDGIRALVDITPERLRLRSRSGRDITAAFPELQALSGALQDALLDGEIIALDQGRPSFSRLADRIHVTDAKRIRVLTGSHPVTYMAFDLLRLYGVDLTPRPLSDRRRSLDQLDLPAVARVSPAYDDGAALFAATLEQGLEGVVAKRLSSPYRPGRRSADWVKTPHRTQSSVLVGGWRPDSGNGRQIGAVLVGTPTPSGDLVFSGRVGSGIGGTESTRLQRELGPLQRAGAPFTDPVPRLDAAGATWTEPTVVVEVSHLGRTDNGRLRQPVYRGIRTDLRAVDLYAEAEA